MNLILSTTKNVHIKIIDVLYTPKGEKEKKRKLCISCFIRTLPCLHIAIGSRWRRHGREGSDPFGRKQASVSPGHRQISSWQFRSLSDIYASEPFLQRFALLDNNIFPFPRSFLLHVFFSLSSRHVCVYKHMSIYIYMEWQLEIIIPWWIITPNDVFKWRYLVVYGIDPPTLIVFSLRN